MRFLLISCCFLFQVRAWERYERTLVEPKEVIDNKHEFILDIGPKLTMSIEHEYKKLAVVDYDVENQMWTERVENQLRPCLETIPLIKGTEPLKADGSVGNFSDLIQFHGLHARVPAINGLFPGEPMVAMFGTEVVIRVRNHQLLNSLTLRGHGLDNVWYQDGEAYLQQCPIPVRSEFVYRFEANVQGTMILRAAFPFYSPISSFSAVMVVKRRNEKLPMAGVPWKRLDLEYMLSVIDWPFVEADQQHVSNDFSLSKWGFGLDRDEQKCTKGGSYFGQKDIRMQKPVALIVNGKGWHNQEDILNRPSKIPFATFKIRSGQNAMFRITHLGFELGVRIHVEDHDSMLVVADGKHTIFQTIDAIVFYPGERYNFHFTGKERPTKKIYRIVLQTVEKFPTESGDLQPIYGLANLEYENVDLGDQDLNKVDWNQNNDCSLQKPCKLANCQPQQADPRYTTCINSGDIGFPDEHNETDILKQRVYSANELEEHFISFNQITKVDGFTYKPPDKMPYYNSDFKSCDQALCHKKSVAEGKTECPCFYYKKFGLGKIIQLVIYNYGPTIDGKPGREIPFHLHSTHFWLVKWAPAVYDINGKMSMFNPDIVCDDRNMQNGCFNGRWKDQAWIQGNLPNMGASPGLRDTIIIPYGGYVVLRFRTQKAGWYMAESMRASERESGLAFAFQIGEQNEMPKPPPDFPKDCGHFEPPPLPLDVRQSIHKTLNM
ncbi:hypothetical protein M3Y97_00741700 [Aphelenchoides bicaudatus]|nr:hypothetical protein M3Y97_00741700 [Aphelenchoides bicaudatus]